ncbi:hypothetical protein ABH922_000925 [Rhodococcus sp. 27YEA15]
MSMAISLSCDACGVVVEIPVELRQLSSADVLSAKPGWTHATNEDYCPICSDVRSSTWGH